MDKNDCHIDINSHGIDENCLDDEDLLSFVPDEDANFFIPDL